MTRSGRWTASAAAAVLLSLAGCSSTSSGSPTAGSGGAMPTTGGSAASAATTSALASVPAPSAAAPTNVPASVSEPATTQPPEPLRILVTNDDGVGAAGIDALVGALTAMDGVEVTVIAPADNRSGTSDTTSDGALPTQAATTAGGYPAVAVDGYPADTIVFALDQGGVTRPPHVVVSGVNSGQNVGPTVPNSGTIGAAREAARHGIPAVAVSAQTGLGDADPPDFAVGAQAAVAWLEDHRDALLAGQVTAHVYSFNAPNCNELPDRGMLDVPVATDLAGRDTQAQPDCATEPTSTPMDDVAGLAAGYVTYTELDPETLGSV